jgi:hypothetical protein
MLVNVQDEVDQELNDFQKRVLRGGCRTGPYCTAPACPHGRAGRPPACACTGACRNPQMLGIAVVLLHNLIKLYEKLMSASAFCRQSPDMPPAPAGQALPASPKTRGSNP